MAISDAKASFGAQTFQVLARVPKQTPPRPRKATMLRAALAVCLIATGAAIAQPARISPTDPTGEWLVAKRIARIKIVDCEGRLWGVVAWEAQPGTDSKNPDPNLRTRPTLGMPILLGMAPSSENKWEGEIYNSEDGHTYSANISLADPNTLRVQGCFLGFLCGGENWTRAEPDSPGSSGVMPGQSSPPKPSASRKTTGTRPTSTDKSKPESKEDVCSRILGPTGLPHERGLK